MAGLSKDGCGVCVAPETLKLWQTACREASSYCEMTYALHMTTAKLPYAKNVNQRKKEAKDFHTDINKGRAVVLRSARVSRSTCRT